MGLLNTGFAFLGAKGASESFKGLNKLDDLNAGNGTAKYFKEGYDTLSQDAEKIKKFASGVSEYGKAFGRGFAKGNNGITFNGVSDPLSALAYDLGRRTINGAKEVRKTSLERFLEKGTLTREKSTSRLRKIATGDAKMSEFLGEFEGNYTKSDFSIHHLISVEDAGIAKLPVMLKAEELGYNINRKSNLIPLPNNVDVSRATGLPLHDNRHIGEYSEAVSERIRELDIDFRNGLIENGDILNRLGEVEDSLREGLLNQTLKLQNHDPNF